MTVYLIRNQETGEVHAYEWTHRCEERDGVPVGWVLQYVQFVGVVPSAQPGIPDLMSPEEYQQDAGEEGPKLLTPPPSE